MAPKNPFRRNHDADRPGPESAADQWFRPEPGQPSKRPSSGRGRGRAAQGGSSGSGSTRRPGPAAEDAPTESFEPPKNWLDDTSESPKPGGAKPGGAKPSGAKPSGAKPSGAQTGGAKSGGAKPAAATAGSAKPVAGGAAAAGGGGRGSGGSGGSGPGGGAGSGPGGPSGPRPPKKRKTKKKKKRRYIQRSLWSLLAISVIGFFMVLIAYSRIEIPEPNEVSQQQTSRVYYAGNEEEIGRFGDINRTIVGLDRMPQHLRDAVLAVENRSFYSDNGVSLKGMARAFWVNLRGGATQGGSTITQQYVKNTYLTSERSIQRKLKEALLAIKIDRERSKDQILEDYLNTIYLGRGAYGVQAASKAYWNKDVQKLNIAQAAALAAIIQRPGAYEPSEPDGLARLKARWTYAVNSMVETGAITADKRAKLTFPKFPKQAKSQSRYGGQRGYILTAIREELQSRGLTKDEIENGGLRIVTTLNSTAQQSALDAIKKEFPKTQNSGLRAGLVAVEPGTGRIIAMYGGRDFLGKGRYAQVSTATYPIQSGSTMKVLTTAALLENGYTLRSTFQGNSPLELPGSKPVNNEFDRDYGTVTLRKALEQSINTAFVQATVKLGATKVRNAIERAGIPADTPGLETNARITLGIASTTAVEIAGAFGTICGGGIQAEPHLVERVLGPNGGEIPIRRPFITPEPVFDEQVIAGTLEAMQDVVKYGTATRAKALNRPAGGKTGTHEDLTAWFTGCTPQLAASVVYFKGDGTNSLDGTAGMSTFFGGTYPAQTWTTFMKGALRGQPVEKFPRYTGGRAPAPEPSKDPFDVGGFDGSDPGGGLPTEGPGPVFPTFDPGPTTVPSATPSPSPTPEASPSVTPTPTPSGSPGPTPTPTPAGTPAPTPSPTPSPTLTPTPAPAVAQAVPSPTAPPGKTD